MALRSFLLGAFSGAGLLLAVQSGLLSNLIEGLRRVVTVERADAGYPVREEPATYPQAAPQGTPRPLPKATPDRPVRRQPLTSVSTVAPARFSGRASYYDKKYDGRLTASGEAYRHDGLTAAHRTLPFGTTLRVTRRDNGRSVYVTVNDRGPYSDDRVIDLSGGAAMELDMIRDGTVTVDAEVLPN